MISVFPEPDFQSANGPTGVIGDAVAWMPH
jgi:hypothetical protein